MLPHPDQIQLLNVVAYVLPQVVVPVAGASERVSGPLQLDYGDFTPAVALFCAPFADKRLPVAYLPTGQRRQVKPLLLQQAFFDSLFDFQRNTIGAHEPRLRRNDDRLAHKRCHGKGDRTVVADPALHEHLVPHRPVAFDTVRIVHTDGIDQPGDDILVFNPFVNGVLDVRGDECGTLVIEVGGMFPLKGHIRDIRHGKTQGFMGRFLQK